MTEASEAKSDQDRDELTRIEGAVEQVQQGVKLPAPKTWDELVMGMAVWFGQHWHDETGEMRACGYCGSRHWEYGHVVALMSDPRWPIRPGENHGSFPHFQLSCTECGNTVLINVLSVFEPQRPWEK
jgi:hypothetical protein